MSKEYVMSDRRCCFGKCNMSKRKDPSLTLYSFPRKDWEKGRKEKWIEVIRESRNDNSWTPTNNSVVCCKHFIGRQKSRNPFSPSYNPSLVTNAVEVKKEGNIEQAVTNFTPANITFVLLPQPILPEPELVFIKCEDSKFDFECQVNCCLEEEENLNIMFCTMENNNASVQTQLQPPNPPKPSEFSHFSHSESNSENTKRGFIGYKNLSTNEAMLQLCGVTLEMFSKLLSLIAFSKDSQPSCYESLDDQDRLVLFLMKLRQGFSFSLLGTLFSVYQTTAFRVFLDTLKTITMKTKSWISLSPKQMIKNELYPNCMYIIDCVEVEVETPDSAEERILMYSSFRHKFVYKFLVCFNFDGGIRQISKAYAGSATEDLMANESGFLRLFEPGDVVLAERELPRIQAELSRGNAVLVVPPFEPALKTEEVEGTCNTGSVRAHVERAIGRVKVHQILSFLEAELKPRVDEIMHVCCVLANNQLPLI